MTNMSPEREKLASCIENLYGVFENYPLPDWVQGNAKQKRSRLHCLKQVSPKKSHRFYEQTTNDFKSLLPRILEMIAFEGFYGQGIIKELYFVTWQKWEKEERISVSNYFISLWRYLLSDYPSPVKNAADIAYGIGYVHTDVTIFLKILEDRCDNLVGIQHLADMVLVGAFDKKLTSQPYVLPFLEKTYYEHVGTPISDKMAFAVKEIKSND